MASKILFLGTAGDSFVSARQQRRSGGIIIESDGLQFHLDPGPGALIRALENGINPRANTCILVSNNSIINSGDLNILVDSMTYGGEDKKGVLVCSNSIINGNENNSPTISKLHKECLERNIILNSGQRVGIEDIEIHALPTNCEDNSGIGFKFYANDFILSYSSDTKYSKEAVDSYKGSDILILNVIDPQGDRTSKLLNSDDVIKIINHVKPKLTIITHFGTNMMRADPISEARFIQNQTGSQVICAKDGMSLSPVSYSAKTDQQRLGRFEEEHEEKKEDEAEKIVTKEPTEQVKEDEEEHKHESHQEKLNSFSESDEDDS